ncbi:hypothetical protein HMPREF9964_1686 [Streptococcus dysgalactiae subsp. equisimilis SK1249]|nr:hypothetical protein HMPREF9964_1686 [Streptococcus dysgalactiae subsp. equisimilis SK1249]
MVEAGTNLKAMQDILGHSDISTTMNIYAEASKDLKEIEMENFGNKIENNLQKIRKA